MSKINKVYPPFFNGVTQQNPELALDSQCKEMTNCVPDLVSGLTKRPPTKFQRLLKNSEVSYADTATIFHTYDRGEDDEEYIMLETGESSDPVRVFNKSGNEMVVAYNATNETEIKTYLTQGNLKGLTVQDRTWVFSKNSATSLDLSKTQPLRSDFDNEAYFWIKRGSGDRYNPFNYAVYLDGITFSVDPDKPSNVTEDPVTGAEDSDVAAELLADKINNPSPVGVVNYDFNINTNNTSYTYTVQTSTNLTGVTAPSFDSSEVVLENWSYNADTGIYSFTVHYYINTTGMSGGMIVAIYSQTKDVTATFNYTKTVNTSFTADVRGSLLRIRKNDLAPFTFSSWDSWGNQASEGWKGSVNKVTDLPKDMAFSNVYVEIKGDESNTFTDYYVKWNGSSWEECLDPTADRGQLTNMPVKMDRTSLVGGVATFTFDLVDWSLPRVGNDENNPDPSFVGQKVQDLFFYKNRLGIASEDSVTLTETANYTNFYASTVTDIVDTDVIDVTIATNQASKIYYAKPFNNSLYIFTKYSQYELVGEGIFSPSTVSLSNTTNYPMATDVEPVVMNDSLYFISTTDNQQQLREYIKTDNLNVKGVDLNVSTPTYLSEPIKHLVVDGVLGYVLCCTSTNIVYLYNFKEDGTKRVQSAWSKWQLLEGLTTEANSFEYYSLGSTVVVTYKTAADYRYNSLQLDYNVVNDNVDTTSSDGSTIVSVPYTSSVLLPDYYPQLTGIRTPMNKVLIKKVTVEGEGNFDATVYRKDYDTTYTKLHTDSMRDLDLHISSKVGNVDITIQDSTENDFKLSSIVLEAMLSITSKELK